MSIETVAAAVDGLSIIVERGFFAEVVVPMQLFNIDSDHYPFGIIPGPDANVIRQICPSAKNRLRFSNEGA